MEENQLDKPERPSGTNWAVFIGSPLALFGGIFSLIEGIILVYLCGVKRVLPSMEGIRVLIITISIFALIVISRPEALHPPKDWDKLRNLSNTTPGAFMSISVIGLLMLGIGGKIYGFDLVDFIRALKRY